MPGKRIVIQLTQDEQHALETYVSQGQQHARAINRARILLLSNAGMKVQDIATVLGVSQPTIATVRKKYHTHEHEHLFDFLQEEPRSGRPITLDSQVEAKVAMIACSAPPAGCARWTLQLLADQRIKLEVVESISHESVRSLLKKTTSSLGEVNNGVSGKSRAIFCGIWKMSSISMLYRMILYVLRSVSTNVLGFSLVMLERYCP